SVLSRGGTHASPGGRSRPPLKPPTAAPPLRGAALLTRCLLIQTEFVEGDVPVRVEDLEAPLLFLLERRLVRIEAPHDRILARGRHHRGCVAEGDGHREGPVRAAVAM